MTARSYLLVMMLQHQGEIYLVDLHVLLLQHRCCKVSHAHAHLFSIKVMKCKLVQFVYWRLVMVWFTDYICKVVVLHENC